MALSLAQLSRADVQLMWRRRGNREPFLALPTRQTGIRPHSFMSAEPFPYVGEGGGLVL